MGVYLSAYAVKLDKVKAAFNSKNEKLLSEIKKTRMFDCYYSQEDSGGIELEEALREIIYGEDKNQEDPSLYGYALLIIIAYFGEELTHEGDIFKVGAINESIENKLSEYQVNFKIRELIETIYEFDTPHDVKDFPTIGGIRKNKIEDMLPKLEKIKISANNLNWDKDAYSHELQAIHILRRSFKFCLDNQLDWISFEEG